MNKKIILGIGTFGCLLIVVGLFLNFNEKNRNELIYGTTSISDDDLIVVSKNSKSGLIDLDGNFIVEPIYSGIREFEGNYATAYKDGKYFLLNKKGEVVVKDANDIDHINENDYWIIDGDLYDENLQIIVKDKHVRHGIGDYLRWHDGEKQAGIMTIYGKITYTYTYSNDFYETPYFSFSEEREIDENSKNRYCVIKVNSSKYGIINCDSGKVIYDYQSNEIRYRNYGVFEITENGKDYQFVIINDKIVLESRDENIKYNGKMIQNYIVIEDNNTKKESYYNILTGETTTTYPSPSQTTTPNTSTTELSDWEKYTGITITGPDYSKGLKKGNKVILENNHSYIQTLDLDVYKYLEKYNKPLIIVSDYKKNETGGLGKYDVYLVNAKTGNNVKIFKNESSRGLTTHNSVFIEYHNDTTDRTVIYSMVNGKEIEFDKYNYLITDFYGNYFTYKNSTTGKKEYYNYNLKKFYEE